MKLTRSIPAALIFPLTFISSLFAQQSDEELVRQLANP